MGFSIEIFDAAEARLRQLKTKAEAEAKERHDVFCEHCPEYKELENTLSKTGSKLMYSIFDPESDVEACVSQLKKINDELQARMAELLKINGLSEDYLEPHYSCTKCSDTGYIDGERCECLESLMKKFAFEKLNMSTPLGICTFESFSLENYPNEAAGGLSPRKIMEKTFLRCKNYAESFTLNSPSLILQGGVGLGKTHLSLAIAGTVIAKGYDVVYGSAQSFFNKIERERFGKAPSYEDTLSLLMSADLLVLDDLGSEFTTQFTVSVLYDIINSRLLAGKPTIISTNLNTEGIEQKYSDRILSRIHGNYNRLQFVGKDMRFTLRRVKSEKNS